MYSHSFAKMSCLELRNIHKDTKKGDSVIPSVSHENVGWANPGKHMVMFLSNKSSEAALADDKIDVIMTSLQWNCLGAIQRCSLTHAGVTSHRFWNWAGFFFRRVDLGRMDLSTWREKIYWPNDKSVVKMTFKKWAAKFIFFFLDSLIILLIILGREVLSLTNLCNYSNII